MSDLQQLRERGREIGDLARQIRELCGDDDLAFADTLDGETDALRAASTAVRTIVAMETMAEAAGALADRYKARSSDFTERGKRARAALVQFLSDIGEKKLVLPEATLTVAAGRMSVVGEPNVDDLPEELVRVKREADRTAIRIALQAGHAVPGCSLSNAPPVLQLRTR